MVLNYKQEVGRCLRPALLPFGPNLLRSFVGFAAAIAIA